VYLYSPFLQHGEKSIIDLGLGVSTICSVSITPELSSSELEEVLLSPLSHPCMSKLHDFLVEHAKFPFPPLDGRLSASTTDISTIEAESLEPKWKAKLAVRDDNLIQKLCGALDRILEDAAPLADATEKSLLASFSPKIQFNELGGENREWSRNPTEAHVSVSGCSSFETEQFRADPGGRLGRCYTSRSSSLHVNVVRYTIDLP
jgi:hypothetical protein